MPQSVFNLTKTAFSAIYILDGNRIESTDLRQGVKDADLVVLATATVPRAGAQELGQRLHVSTDEHGFFSEAHPKLRPVESLTAGVYLAGAAQFPKDIPETVAQASGAASKVLSLFSQRQMVQEPTIAYVDPELCSGCGLCIPACPYEARTMHDWQHIAVVNTATGRYAIAVIGSVNGMFTSADDTMAALGSDVVAALGGAARF